MNNSPNDNPDRPPRSHHGREHLPPNPAEVGALVWQYTAVLRTRKQILRDHITDNSFYHPAESIILAENILKNESDAVAVLDDPSVNEDQDPLLDERTLILDQAALLLMHADKELPGMSELAQRCVDRINDIELKLVKRAIEANLLPKDAQPSLISLSTIEERLNNFTAEAEKGRKHRPRSKWLGSGATWPLRPKK